MLSRWLAKHDDWREKYAGHAAAAPAGPLGEFCRRELPAADCPLSDVPMIAIDVETTGLDPDTDSIVSIGMITMDLERIYCRDARHWIFKPERSLRHEVHPELRDHDPRGNVEQIRVAQQRHGSQP